MDLKTGHGSVNAAAASAASVSGATKLMTWQTSSRIIAPTPKMVSASSTVVADVIASTGTGVPLVGERITFTSDRGGTVVHSSATTNAAGRLPVRFSSTAGGTTTQMSAHRARFELPLDAFVLQRDENTPGVRMPRSGFRNALRPPTDIDDVFRVYLRSGETMRASLGAMDSRSEYGDLFLHRGTTRDVTDPFLAPLREPEPYNNQPKVLRRTVSSDGVRYLDVFGYGSYRLHWSIYSPRKIRALDVSPRMITPDGDGQADRAAISWRLARAGALNLRILKSDGSVVRRVNFGAETAGARTYRWNGRNGAGSLVGAGTYRIKLQWRNGPRVSTAATQVTVSR
ncbi:MAG: hypothetical protein ICV72_12795 [Aldersonia sp.]|nr:hypothetical protein [Aldersonia sp.]